MAPEVTLHTLDTLRELRAGYVRVARACDLLGARRYYLREAQLYHRQLLANLRQLRTLRRFSHFTDEGIAVHE